MNGYVVWRLTCAIYKKSNLSSSHIRIGRVGSIHILDFLAIVGVERLIAIGDGLRLLGWLDPSLLFAVVLWLPTMVIV